MNQSHNSRIFAICKCELLPIASNCKLCWAVQYLCLIGKINKLFYPFVIGEGKTINICLILLHTVRMLSKQFAYILRAPTCSRIRRIISSHSHSHRIIAKWHAIQLFGVEMRTRNTIYANALTNTHKHMQDNVMVEEFCDNADIPYSPF